MKIKKFLTILLTVIIFVCGCQTLAIPPESQITVYQGFSVHFLDVGQGDCIFIKFNDGKTALIDCGERDVERKNFEIITNYLTQYTVSKIDYFILTHPDSDHVGNAVDIVNTYEIGRAYLPFISNELRTLYTAYNAAYDLLEDKNVSIINTDYFNYVIGGDYQIAFLSPAPKGVNGSSYDDFSSNAIPDETECNNLSPIIYLEYNNKRFVFTGDAGVSQERLVLDNYNSGFYDAIFNRHGISVDLDGIDYLKVSHHGANDASCVDFLNLLRPAHAIISVGGNNYYGHPKSEVLVRLQEANPEYRLFRTDMLGTVSVYEEERRLVIT